ncbi:hypothetical protein UG55_102252 [Frankia sp. EI5c]|uniref:hypothetical protein n=1 Tax=Frankia sp. EI5c TaxID=683316 RepID=UPI0007C3C3CC|nr:hypothetical protein [Frankia sp. EI5c]OAA25392.1 hypothetical protein UG55_102252 [Frankia sp. EI5c]
MSGRDLDAPKEAGAGHVGRIARRSVPSPETRAAVRAQAVDLGLWLAAAAFGLLVASLVIRTGVELTGSRTATEPVRGLAAAGAERAAAPFRLAWRAPRLAPAVLLPVSVAIVTLALARRSTRVRWAVLLLLGFAGSLAWSVALAAAAGPDLSGGLRPPPAYLAAARAVGDDPLGYLADWGSGPPTGSPAAATAATADGGAVLVPGPAELAGHPPGPILLVWTLDRLGIGGVAGSGEAVALGLALTVLTAAAVPLVAVAVRSLCHETAARRAVPVLVLTPWALWAAASPEAVTILPAAAALAVGVVGCEPGRRWPLLWALASGLLLGVTSLFDYAAVWLGVGVAAAYFVRRRPLMNVFTGLGALLPFWLFFAWGFSWPDGLAGARASAGVTTMLAWLAMDVAVVVLAGGPVLARAVRRVRLTPGWPFLVGAGSATLFSLCAGLAWGGVEQAWLPLAPWLAVAALAPRPRPDGPGDTVRAGDLPMLLLGASALVAVILRVVLSGG